MTLTPVRLGLFLSVVPPDSSLTWFKIECGKFCASTVLYKENFLTCKMSVMAGLSWQFDEIQNHLQGGGASGILLRGSLVVFIEKGRHSPQWAVPFPRQGSWSKGAECMPVLFSSNDGDNVTSYLRLLAAWLLCHDRWYFDMWTELSPFSFKLFLSDILSQQQNIA